MRRNSHRLVVVPLTLAALFAFAASPAAASPAFTVAGPLAEAVSAPVLDLFADAFRHVMQAWGWRPAAAPEGVARPESVDKYGGAYDPNGAD